MCRVSRACDNQISLISLLFRWSHLRKEKSSRLKNKTVIKHPETDVHMLGCGISRENPFSFICCRESNF